MDSLHQRGKGRLGWTVFINRKSSSLPDCHFLFSFTSSSSSSPVVQRTRQRMMDKLYAMTPSLIYRLVTSFYPPPPVYPHCFICHPTTTQMRMTMKRPSATDCRHHIVILLAVVVVVIRLRCALAYNNSRVPYYSNEDERGKITEPRNEDKFSRVTVKAARMIESSEWAAEKVVSFVVAHFPMTSVEWHHHIRWIEELCPSVPL